MSMVRIKVYQTFTEEDINSNLITVSNTSTKMDQ